VLWVLLFTCACVALTAVAWGQEKDKKASIDEKEPILDNLLNKIEKRYAGPGFSAEFKQQSTIAAMEITDNASGKLFVKRPGKMRWEYVQPESQIIISDGDDLWIYRKEDNQVMLGKAPSFFANGKGAGFLSDLKTLRTEFTITLEGKDDKENQIIKLVPKKESVELTRIHMTVSSQTDTIDQIVTLNGYGDETQIDISQYHFNQELPDDMFLFEIPDGAEVLQMD
jgi:outer membrane lipoprotein carrier protein